MSDLSVLFPNLTVIRGHSHLSVGQVVPRQEFESTPVLLIRHTKLRAVGLLRLRFSGSRLALIDNPRMCHTELANWHSASGSRTEDTRFVNRGFNRVAFGLLQFCSNVSVSTSSPESRKLDRLKRLTFLKALRIYMNCDKISFGNDLHVFS